MVWSDCFAELNLNIFSLDAPSTTFKEVLLLGKIGEIFFFSFDLVLEDACKVRGCFFDFATERIRRDSKKSGEMMSSPQSGSE